MVNECLCNQQMTAFLHYYALSHSKNIILHYFDMLCISAIDLSLFQVQVVKLRIVERFKGALKETFMLIPWFPRWAFLLRLLHSYTITSLHTPYTYKYFITYRGILN